MPDLNPKTHTIKSVKLVIESLEKLLASARVSLTEMEEEPPMNEVSVNYQNALEVGQSRMQTWVDSLRDCVRKQRMKLAVSDSPSGSAKPRKKTP